MFIITAAILLLPESLAQSLHLEFLTTEYRRYVSLGLIVSGAVLAVIMGQQFRPLVRRRIVSPLLKLAFPVKDTKTGVTQSRIRYYAVRFSSPSGTQRSAYMEIDSNGNKVRYTDRQGRTLVPDEPYEESVLSEGAFQFPAWGRVDWKDVFNGDDASGRWGIRYASTR